MYYHRTVEPYILEAAQQFRVILITGPRQAGKTTLLQHLCEPDRRYVTLDDPNLRLLATDDPALFMQQFPPPLLIDEIQYAPQLLPYIKMSVDTHQQPGAYWLTGSQQFAMMQGVTESLAGRVAIINLLGFSPGESSQQPAYTQAFLPTQDYFASRQPCLRSYSLQEVFHEIWLGSFPALVSGQVRNHQLFYSSYLQTYLERDVRALSQVGDLEAFLRFLKACAARTAQMLNLTDLARDTDISVPTAKAWLSILVASSQVFLLRPYHSNITKRLIKTPKLYFLDTGLCAYLTDWSSPETLASGAMRGAIFETFVVSCILKSWWHTLREPNAYYYRDKDKKEIDLVFEQDHRLHPLEIKLGATVKREWIKIFPVLQKLGKEIGAGGVLCLIPERLPISRTDQAIPVSFL